MGDGVYSSESRNGVRCTWQYWPPNKLTATRNVIPVAMMYTPLKPIEGMALVEYEPVRCQNCKGVLNPLVFVDFTAKAWNCPFCNSRNRFPPNYQAHITETTLPAELMAQFTTMEYILPNTHVAHPILIFLVDTAGYPEELESLRASLKQSVNLLPAEALVGFMTYGKNCYLYDLSSVDCTRCYAFRGDKSYTADMIKEQLGLVGHDPRGIQKGASKFLMPASECEFTLNAILDELAKDAWPVPSDSRALRCVGNSLFIALNLLEIAYPHQGARVMLFAGGAASHGPGKIVGEKLADVIRTQHDIKNDNAKYAKSAVSVI
jgi:protein transport protein SEC23